MEKLIKAAWREPVVTADFERRVMLAVARAESDRLRRRARWTAMAAAACLVGLLLTLPVDTLLEELTVNGEQLKVIFQIAK